MKTKRINDALWTVQGLLITLVLLIDGTALTTLGEAVRFNKIPFQFVWSVDLAQSRSTQLREGETIMRFMVLVKANRDSEAGHLPDKETFAAMHKYNEELTKAGVMLAAEGLQPSSQGARVKFSGEKRTVIDGPFAETKELVAGFWLWQAHSKEEAIEWLKRAPFDGGAEVEIRQICEMADLCPALSPELAQRETQMRENLTENIKTSH